MSMDEQDCRNAYVECLACDQAIFTLGGQDEQAQYVTLSNGEGRLHKHCRAQYEADNGAVLCEQDDAPEVCQDCGSTGPLTEDDYAEKRCASCKENKEQNDAERAFERTLSGDDGGDSMQVQHTKAWLEKQQAKGRRG